jgi:hypothetical protein
MNTNQTSEPVETEEPTTPVEDGEVATPEPEQSGEVPASGTPDEESQTFSGGKNHYIRSLKKNKTQRHHKRRNRHHTLRK